MSTARQAAIANENREIEDSQSRAIAARTAESRPRNALEAMATKLEISPANLKKTLLNTVFAECKNEEQFMALIVVSNAYGLNPLTKEIYAFPAKGGGIVPMVSVDGWIRLMNEHPAFDGIEFDYTLDSKGSTTAIEAVIHRSDRKHPIKVMELMSECKGTTIPWTKSPSRMLRHRALIQCVRVAFGFSGIVAEGDEEVVDAQYREVQSLPSRQTLAEELDDEIPAHDKQTGEIVGEPTRDPKTGMTRGDEETERQLDAGNDGTLSEDNPTAAEGPADEQRGEGHTDQDEKPAWHGKVQWIREAVAKAKNKQNLKDADDEFTKIRVGLPDDVIGELDGLIADRRRELTRSASLDG